MPLALTVLRRTAERCRSGKISLLGLTAPTLKLGVGDTVEGTSRPRLKISVSVIETYRSETTFVL